MNKLNTYYGGWHKPKHLWVGRPIFGIDYKPKIYKLPSKIDLSGEFPPVRDQGQLGSCHDYLTEVLTDKGFKLFSDLDGSERLASVDPITNSLTYEIPTRLIRFNYKGKLICCDQENINFKVTPDHNMLVRKWNQSKRTLNDNYELVKAKDLGWYCGLMNRVNWVGENSTETYNLPAVFDHHRDKNQRLDKEVSMSVWLKFLGLYLAEGTLLKRDQQKGKKSYKIQIAASKEREKQFARSVFKELDINALELNDRFTFQNRQIYEALAILGLESVKAPNKFVPAFVFHQNANLIKDFLLGHFSGDGYLDKELKAHYTSSSKLANDLQTLIFLSGNEAHIGIREARIAMTGTGRAIVGVYPEHRISVCEKKGLSIDRKSQIYEEDYDGEVFCAEVPTFHTLVTRRDGKILISGNCTSFAWTGALQHAAMKEKLSMGSIEPSELAFYWQERYTGGYDVNSDTGASLTDGAHVSMNQGWIAESVWPYDISKFTQTPPSGPIIGRDLVCLSTNQNEVDIKTALAEGYGVPFGVVVYESFEEAKGGVIPMPNMGRHLWCFSVFGERVLGGHAIVLVGYDDSTRYFKFRNSWGLLWGDNGYGYLPYKYVFSTSLASDFWTIRKVG